MSNKFSPGDTLSRRSKIKYTGNYIFLWVIQEETFAFKLIVPVQQLCIWKDSFSYFSQLKFSSEITWYFDEFWIISEENQIFKTDETVFLYANSLTLRPATWEQKLLQPNHYFC